VQNWRRTRPLSPSLSKSKLVGEFFAREAQLEGVEAEAGGKLFADLDAADAVAAGVEQRREDADAGDARDDGADAAADAALGGEADSPA
jgi:hypothetical protein